MCQNFCVQSSLFQGNGLDLSKMRDNEMRYKCDKCEYLTHRPGRLKEHIDVKHLNIGKYTFSFQGWGECLFLVFLFSYLSLLRFPYFYLYSSIFVRISIHILFSIETYFQISSQQIPQSFTLFESLTDSINDWLYEDWLK